MRAVASAFPTITTVSVKDAIDVVNQLIGQLATAIRAASAVALVASVLVLGGRACRRQPGPHRTMRSC